MRLKSTCIYFIDSLHRHSALKTTHIFYKFVKISKRLLINYTSCHQLGLTRGGATDTLNWGPQSSKGPTTQCLNAVKILLYTLRVNQTKTEIDERSLISCTSLV